MRPPDGPRESIGGSLGKFPSFGFLSTLWLQDLFVPASCCLDISGHLS